MVLLIKDFGEVLFSVALNISNQDNQIVLNLISEGAFSRQQLDNLSSDHEKNLTNLKNSLFNKIYSFNSENSAIDIYDGQLKKTASINIPLENKINLKEENLNVWANSTLIFNEENKRVGDFYWNSGDETFIGLINNDSYLYNRSFENDKYLIKSNNFIMGVVQKNKSESGPFDLFCFPINSLLCVSDRGSGNIYLVDLKSEKFFKSFSIRNPGINKSINLSIAAKSNKLFITDNISTNISIIDLQSLEMTNANPGIGILGNIVVSPDELSIYCLTLKPKESLKLIDINNYSLKKDFSLKGNLFSLGDSPYDLLTLSPDKKFVYLLTHIPDPDPFTPVITVIETDKEKATQRFSIKDGTKIINIGFADNNPLFKENKNILDLLVTSNLVNHDKINSVKKQIEDETNNNQLMENFNIRTDTSVMETLPGRNTFSISSGNQEEAKKEEIEWEIKLEPKKIEFCNITPGLDEIIYKKCREKLMKDYEIILKNLSDKEEWENSKAEIDKRFKAFDAQVKNKENILSIRLNDAITKARQELEWHDMAIIRLIGLLDKYNFEMAFMRDDALELIRQKERDELIEKGLKTVATNCPNCDAQLLGSYTCRACGFELEKPEDMMKRRILMVSTFHPLENLRQGHLIITDTINHKIIETDHFRRIIYELKKDVLHSDIQVELEMPRDAIRLKNNITLVVDYGNNRVFKLTQKGKLYWELDYSLSPENKLNKPVSIAALESGNTIIVDSGNHRIIEVNEDHEIVWKYGQKGIEGIEDGMLRLPTFFQRTKGATNVITDSMNHRVIELDGNKIIWQYGNEKNVEGDGASGNGANQLNKPLTAWRFENGNTLILDSGNHRVIEVTPDKKIHWEYRTNQGENQDIPVKAFRLKSGKVMIIGEKKVVEVDYGSKEVTWASSIDELTSASSDSDITTMSENVKKTKVFHGVKNPYARHIQPEVTENDKLKSYVDSKKSELTNRAINRSPVLLAPNAQIQEKDFLLIDKSKAEIYLVDRKGIKKWEFTHPDITKPQGIYFSDKSVFITDANAKKIFEVDINSKEIIWSYKDNSLVSPKSIELISNGNLLITDQLAGRIIEINKSDSSKIWEYKNQEVLKTPYHAKRLNNGNTLVTDWGGHIVYEITPNEDIVWSYGEAKKSGHDNGLLSYPEHALRLDNGNTLITDTRNGRVIEVTPDKNIIWSNEGHGLHKLMSPLLSMRLNDGHTVIIHSNYKQVLEVNKQGEFLWKYIHQERRI